MKRAKPPARRPKPSRKTVIGISVSAPTRKQVGALKKLFKAHAVSTLGVAPTLVAQKQQYETRRKRGR